MRIGIVGSRQYSNKRRIKEFVFALKEKFGENIEIVSGGQKEGADGYAKKYALEFDMKYAEFPPTHYPYNVHCVRPRFEYGKQYATWHYHKRNKQIVEYSDKIVAFIPKDVVSKGTFSTIKEAKKVGKKVVIIN
ncbi:hypothetical protein CMO86_05290 [Candidatus Woesearchaeota archaeon]|jgi:hypothetical protein|nr:hypothetical protein [Candidatus Woesearchaeota archaeon]|tara:strand:+ start:6481 stop:6882 length:402 start_codon:yes stop_codon:yes gene_type:complete